MLNHIIYVPVGNKLIASSNFNSPNCLPSVGCLMTTCRPTSFLHKNLCYKPNNEFLEGLQEAQSEKKNVPNIAWT